MRLWVKVLPIVMVEWIAKKHCERIKINGWTVVNPFSGVLFIIGDQCAKQPKERKVDE